MKKKTISILFLIFAWNFCALSMENLKFQLKALQESLRELNQDLNKIVPPARVTSWSVNINEINTYQDINENRGLAGFWEDLRTSRFKLPDQDRSDPEKLAPFIDQKFKEHEALFQDLVIPSNPQTIKAFQTILKDLLIAFFTPETEGLEWCPCPLSDVKRLALIIQVIQDALEKYPDKKQLLVYTSLGSGTLLQEYLNLSALIKAGYKNIQVNIIDLMYPDEPIKEGKWKKEIRAFKNKLDNLAYKNQATITVTEYLHALDYLSRDVIPKSHILIMADPGEDFLDLELTTIDPLKRAFPTETTVFGLSAAPRKAKDDIVYSDFYLFVPKHQAIQVYQNKQLMEDPQVKEMREQLLNPKLLQAMPEKLKEFGEKPPEIIKNLLLSITSNRSFINRLLLITYPDSELWKFYSDPHLMFQDLVRENAEKNPIIYVLVQEQPGSPKMNSVIHKIIPAEYIQADVVMPYSGYYLLQKRYEKIHEYPRFTSKATK